MSQFPVLSESQIERISQIIGEDKKGSEISALFESLGIVDNSGESTKWRRIRAVFVQEQRRTGLSNLLFAFIKKSLSPVLYVDRIDTFTQLRCEINKVLAFSGVEFREDGEFCAVTKAATISEVQKRVSSLRDKLLVRGVHPRVLKYCKEELLQENYFHAVFEAAKSLADYIREQTGLSTDGSILFEKALSVNHPYIAMSNLQTDSERSQQTGLCKMLCGVYSMVRNVTAHTPKIKWIVDEESAIDILSTISFLHKCLDQCYVVKKEN